MTDSTSKAKRSAHPRRVVLKGLSAFALTGLTGCGGLLPGQGPPESLYRLTPKSTFANTSQIVDWQLVIERPVSNSSLDTTRIALLRTPTQVEYYARAGWIDRAPSMIQTLLIESFENSGRIVSVGRENVGLRSDFVLKVELREFAAFYTSETEADVVVALILKLVEMPRRAIIGSKRFSASQAANGESLVSVVEAFDEALGKVLKRSVSWTIKLGEENWQARRADLDT